MSNGDAAGAAVKTPRILFFGMECAFSLPVLQALLASRYEICAVVLPGVPSPIPYRHTSHIIRKEPPGRLLNTLPMLDTFPPLTISQLAWQRHIPLWEVSSLKDGRVLDVLAAYQPDLICVACFSLVLPESILRLPHLGCLNVHPSLLPAYRGPLPLFWMLYEGVQQVGVTVHSMERRLDSGDMLAQEALTLPDGLRYTEIEALIASHGGTLLIRTIDDLCMGRATRTPQDESHSSYQPFPDESAYRLEPARWRARQLYNFVYAVASKTTLLELPTGERTYLIHDAISYSLDVIDVPGQTASDTQVEVVELNDDVVMVNCQDGWVKLAKIRL